MAGSKEIKRRTPKNRNKNFATGHVKSVKSTNLLVIACGFLTLAAGKSTKAMELAPRQSI